LGELPGRFGAACAVLLAEVLALAQRQGRQADEEQREGLVQGATPTHPSFAPECDRRRREKEEKPRSLPNQNAKAATRAAPPRRPSWPGRPPFFRGRLSQNGPGGG